MATAPAGVTTNPSLKLIVDGSVTSVAPASCTAMVWFAPMPEGVMVCHVGAIPTPLDRMACPVVPTDPPMFHAPLT